MNRETDNRWRWIRHFEPREFACHCGKCGSDGTEMSFEFVMKLDDMRHRLGTPLVVSSGYRCPDWNDTIASTGRDGPHTTGRAVDLAVSGELVFRIITQASLGGWFTGIGLNQRGPHEQRFIHLDDLAAPEHPRPRVWTY